jgi:hypothetical protein
MKAYEELICSASRCKMASMRTLVLVVLVPRSGSAHQTWSWTSMRSQIKELSQWARESKLNLENYFNYYTFSSIVKA